MTDVSEILISIQSGDLQATEKLLPVVYHQLRELAAAKLLGERSDHTLQPTALVHEAYLRLVGDDPHVSWNSRNHFFGAAAEAMRRILIDHARAKSTQKRGAGWQRLDLNDIQHPALADHEKLMALDHAIDELEIQDPQKAQLVKLRFFAGLSNKQAAEVLDISEATADRYWSFARAWLHVQIGDA